MYIENIEPPVQEHLPPTYKTTCSIKNTLNTYNLLPVSTTRHDDRLKRISLWL